MAAARAIVRGFTWLPRRPESWNHRAAGEKHQPAAAVAGRLSLNPPTRRGPLGGRGERALGHKLFSIRFRWPVQLLCFVLPHLSPTLI